MSPILYVTRAGPRAAEDGLDLRFLIASPAHDLRAVIEDDVDALRGALESSDEPVNLIVVDGYAAVAALLADDPTLFRRRVARLFLVGGQVNDYRQGRAGEIVPIDPHLKERHPERFAAEGDPRETDPRAFARLLTSGEAVIWLPRDLSLWRYNVEGVTEEAVLLSAPPALCLAQEPDATLWLRLFRAIPARVEVGADSRLTTFDPRSPSPNLYVVVAIDGRAMSKLLTETLRSVGHDAPDAL